MRDEIIANGEGKLYLVSDFAHYLNDNTVYKTLSRFVKEGFLERIIPGIYLYPIKTKYGLLMPSLLEVSEVIARRDNVEIIPSGATALNILGLSEQVPTKAVFSTSGSTRNVKVGNREIAFKKVPNKNFAYKNSKMALVVSAMKELGEDNITPDILAKIRDILSDINKEELIEDLRVAPQWIRNYLIHY